MLHFASISDGVLEAFAEILEENLLVEVGQGEVGEDVLVALGWGGSAGGFAEAGVGAVVQGFARQAWASGEVGFGGPRGGSEPWKK